MTNRDEVIDELLAGRDPSSVMRRDGLLGNLKKALLNRLMAPSSTITCPRSARRMAQRAARTTATAPPASRS